MDVSYIFVALEINKYIVQKCMYTIQKCLYTIYTVHIYSTGLYRGADKSLARPTSRCILFDGESISIDASLVIYINSTKYNYHYK